MATIKQKKTAKALVDNLHSKPIKTAQELLENVGYSEGIAKNPKVVLESKGVKEELAILGFDEQSAKEVVGDILLNGDDDKDRLKAAEMVFKVHGSFAPDKHLNVNVDVESSEVIKSLTKKLNDVHRA